MPSRIGGVWTRRTNSSACGQNILKHWAAHRGDLVFTSTTGRLWPAGSGRGKCRQVARSWQHLIYSKTSCRGGRRRACSLLSSLANERQDGWAESNRRERYYHFEMASAHPVPLEASQDRGPSVSQSVSPSVSRRAFSSSDRPLARRKNPTANAEPARCK